jgi:hypothetical protein
MLNRNNADINYHSSRSNLIGNIDELNNDKYNALKWSRKHIFAIEDANQLPSPEIKRAENSQEDGKSVTEVKKFASDNGLLDG